MEFQWCLRSSTDILIFLLHLHDLLSCVHFNSPLPFCIVYPHPTTVEYSKEFGSPFLRLFCKGFRSLGENNLELPFREWHSRLRLSNDEYPPPRMRFLTSSIGSPVARHGRGFWYVFMRSRDFTVTSFCRPSIGWTSCASRHEDVLFSIEQGYGFIRSHPCDASFRSTPFLCSVPPMCQGMSVPRPILTRRFHMRSAGEYILFRRGGGARTARMDRPKGTGKRKGSEPGSMSHRTLLDLGSNPWHS